jgi:hypothetical protein
MADERALEAAERVFGILAMPTYDDATKLQICIRYLQTCTDDVFADFPRECKAIVAGAFEYGATWQMVAAAAHRCVRGQAPLGGRGGAGHPLTGR